MTEAISDRHVRIAAALIVDQTGRMLLVRKRGTLAFMQAGGKIEASETPREALSRELTEELCVDLDSVPHEFLGHFAARAAHEENHIVSAEIFYVQIDRGVKPAAEIEEIVWIDPFAAHTIPLAPLTRDLVAVARRRLAISASRNS